MGLFIVHMVEYFELYWYKPEPGAIHNIVFFIFGGKAYSIFALLFGVSFFILMDNNRQRGVNFHGRFVWRVSLLLLLGVLHNLLYGGDILQSLAVAGFLLAALYYLPTPWVFVIALGLVLQVPSLVRLILFSTNPESAPSQPEFWALMGINFNHYAHSSVIEIAQNNATQGYYTKWIFGLETGHHWNLLGLALLGFILGRTRFFEQLKNRSALCIKLLVLSTALAALLYTLQQYIPSVAEGGMASWTLNEMVTRYFCLAVITVYILGIALLFHLEIPRKILSTLIPCGRMTLTLYVSQSLVFIPLFYGYGAGWYEFIGQSNSLMIGVVAWGMQMLFATLWLKHFRYGPLEWCWRSATYLRWIPNRATETD